MSVAANTLFTPKTMFCKSDVGYWVYFVEVPDVVASGVLKIEEAWVLTKARRWKAWAEKAVETHPGEHVSVQTFGQPFRTDLSISTEDLYRLWGSLLKGDHLAALDVFKKYHVELLAEPAGAEYKASASRFCGYPVLPAKWEGIDTIGGRAPTKSKSSTSSCCRTQIEIDALRHYASTKTSEGRDSVEGHIQTLEQIHRNRHDISTNPRPRQPRSLARLGRRLWSQNS